MCVSLFFGSETVNIEKCFTRVLYFCIHRAAGQPVHPLPNLLNIFCDIASNKQIETRELYNRNNNSIINFTRIYNKNKVTLHSRKCDPDF